MVTKAIPEMRGASHKLQRLMDEQEFVRKNQKAFRSLTDRELEVFTLLAEGNNNPKIADKLLISRYTVEDHRRNVNKKLGNKNFNQIYKFAQCFDLI